MYWSYYTIVMNKSININKQNKMHVILRDGLAFGGARGGGGARAVQHLEQLACLGAHARVHVHLPKPSIHTLLH